MMIFPKTLPVSQALKRIEGFSGNNRLSENDKPVDVLSYIFNRTWKPCLKDSRSNYYVLVAQNKKSGE